MGANELFIGHLGKYTLDEKLIPVLTLQLEKIFNHFNNNTIADSATLRKRLKELQEKLKQVKIRNGMGEIDMETYELTSEHIQNEIQKIEGQLPRFQPQLSTWQK